MLAVTGNELGGKVEEKSYFAAIAICFVSGIPSALLVFHKLTHGAMSALWPVLAIYDPAVWIAYAIFVWLLGRLVIGLIVDWRGTRLMQLVGFCCVLACVVFNTIVKIS